MNIINKLITNTIPLLPEIYDEPFGDSSQIPTTLICKVARNDVKVALTGDAGDEIFCGYNRYKSVEFWNVSRKIPKQIASIIS